MSQDPGRFPSHCLPRWGSGVLRRDLRVVRFHQLVEGQLELLDAAAHAVVDGLLVFQVGQLADGVVVQEGRVRPDRQQRDVAQVARAALDLALANLDAAQARDQAVEHDGHRAGRGALLVVLGRELLPDVPGVVVVVQRAADVGADDVERGGLVVAQPVLAVDVLLDVLTAGSSIPADRRRQCHDKLSY